MFTPAPAPGDPGVTPELAAVLVERQLALLKTYRWLVDVRTANFYTDRVWERLPSSWREALDASTLDELADLADLARAPRASCWPLSLLAFNAACRAASLPRTHAEMDTAARIRVGGGERGGAKGAGTRPLALLPPALRYGVRPKKAHEVSSLAPIIAQLVLPLGVKHLVVDLGAGQGHLSTLLSRKYGLRCVALDADAELVQTGRARAHTTQKMLDRAERSDGARATAAGVRSGGAGGAVGLGTCLISGTTDAAALEAAVARALADGRARARPQPHGRGNVGPTAPPEPSESEAELEYVLVGLHTCGDLAPACLRLARQSLKVRAVLLVGCCYQRCSEDLCTSCVSEPAADARGNAGAGAVGELPVGATSGQPPAEATLPFGYPLSALLRAAGGAAFLGKAARGLACHEAERYAARLRAAAEPGAEGVTSRTLLKMHAWRAALEEVVRVLRPLAPTERLGQGFGRDAADFKTWAVKALHEIMGGEAFMASSAEATAAIERADALTARWARAVAFHALQLALAHVIEGLLACDRLLFLAQPSARGPAPAAQPLGREAVQAGAAARSSGRWSAHLRAVFEPSISPRNFALIATRSAQLPHHSLSGPGSAGSLPDSRPGTDTLAVVVVAPDGARSLEPWAREPRAEVQLGRLWTTIDDRESSESDSVSSGCASSDQPDIVVRGRQ